MIKLNFDEPKFEQKLPDQTIQQTSSVFIGEPITPSLTNLTDFSENLRKIPENVKKNRGYLSNVHKVLNLDNYLGKHEIQKISYFIF